MNTLAGAPVVPGLPITPLSLGNNRLATLASLFSEWRPRSIKLRYVPTTGSFANGNYILAYTRDPSKLMVDSSTSATYVPSFDLTVMSEQDKVVTGMISAAWEMDIIRAGEWNGDEWLVCSQTNFSGLISRLSSAGTVYGAVLGQCQNQSSGAALTGQTGQFWLEYDLEFRGNNDDEIARQFSQVFQNLVLQSQTGVGIGSALQFVFRDATTGSLVIPGNEVIVVQLTTALTTVAAGIVIGKNALVYLAKSATLGIYVAFATLADALHETANQMLATVATIATVSQPVAFIMPITNVI